MYVSTVIVTLEVPCIIRMGFIIAVKNILRNIKMKCPHCNYQDYWQGISGIREGEHDDFYHIHAYAERLTHGGQQERVYLYGCPSCKKTFIKGDN